MATMTRRAHLYSMKDSDARKFTDVANMVDDNDNSYAYTSATNTSIPYWWLIGFDFSDLPDGSTINNMYVSVKAATGKYVYFYYQGCGRFENNAIDSWKTTSSSKILDKDKSTPTIITIDKDKLKISDWSLSEIKRPYDPSNYSGFALRLGGSAVSGSGGKSIQIYYADLTIDYTPPRYTISTAVSPSGTGSVSGGGTYDSGSTITLAATPASGYRFVRWSDNNTNATRPVTVSGNVTYTAYFERDSLPEPDITNIVFQPNPVQASQYAVVTVTMENIT